MAQLTLEIDPETLRGVEEAAEESGLPVERWVTQLLQEQMNKTWPEKVSSLAGSWNDAPLAEELRASEVPDLPRETI